MERRWVRQLTWIPRQAIRDHCRWCCENREKEIEICPSERCPLHPYRMVGLPAGNDLLLKTIRRKCLDCMSGSRAEVRECTSLHCALWGFRLGNNPFFRQVSEGSSAPGA